jgi:hypothetical protein
MIKLTLTQSIYVIGPLALILALPFSAGAQDAGVLIGYLSVSGLVAIIINLGFDGFGQRELLHQNIPTAKSLLAHRIKVSVLVLAFSLLTHHLLPSFAVLTLPIIGGVSISLAILAQGIFRVQEFKSYFLKFGVVSNVFAPTFLILATLADLLASPEPLFEIYSLILCLSSLIFLVPFLRSLTVQEESVVSIGSFYIEGARILPHTIGLYLLLYTDRLTLTFLGLPTVITETARAAIFSSALFALMSVIINPLTKNQFDKQSIFKSVHLVRKYLVVWSISSLGLLICLACFITLAITEIEYQIGDVSDFLFLAILYLFIPISSLSYAVVGGQLFMHRDGTWYGTVTIFLGSLSAILACYLYQWLGNNVMVFPLAICFGYSLLSLATLVRAKIKWDLQIVALGLVTISIPVTQTILGAVWS